MKKYINFAVNSLPIDSLNRAGTRLNFLQKVLGIGVGYVKFHILTNRSADTHLDNRNYSLNKIPVY